MNIDFAIIYFGLTRSLKKTYKNHHKYIYNVLKFHNYTYKIFLHTWKTNNNKQRIWNNIIDKEIDYDEYKLLNPDYYKIDNQDDFLNTININNYFYQDIWDKYGDSKEGEWIIELIYNHLCALESQKRGLNMVENFINEGNKIKYVIFIRPDIYFKNRLPLYLIPTHKNIILPIIDKNEGYNDKFALIKYENANIYGKRINELAEFRKYHGRIVSEKYLKYIINNNNLDVILINLNFILIRP